MVVDAGELNLFCPFDTVRSSQPSCSGFVIASEAVIEQWDDGVGPGDGVAGWLEWNRS